MKYPNRKINRLTSVLPAALIAVVPAQTVLVAPAVAQTTSLPAQLPEGAPAQQAAFLVDGAFKIANSAAPARVASVRGAAALLPRLLPAAPGSTALNRDGLTARWLKLAQTVPRGNRLDALDAFFDVATKTDLPWAAQWAGKIPDNAGRAGAYLAVSRGFEATRTPQSWAQADTYAAKAQSAARAETDLTARARALTFVAYRMTELSPARQEEALREASSQVRLIQTPKVRDNLLLELTGAAARYDLSLGRRMAADISDEGLKNLASARVNLAEVSQTTLTTRSKERVTALAAAAAPYDSRALPVLLQLTPQPEVLKAIGDTLPRIYPTARPAIEVSQLERIWNYTQTAPAGAYRDQLQSRLARIMVLKDLWRGRSWGKQLTWQGGRIQVGAFLNDVLKARRSNLGAGRLQDTAQGDVAIAYAQSVGLPAAARAEALLLLAGQILG
ncbi:hypothetical protein EON80_12895 [bacterium]|nr:MAG: hypothetical protein EON80_12895 [bacterium]